MALKVTKQVSLVLGVVLTLFIITIIILTVRPEKPNTHGHTGARHGPVVINVVQDESTTQPTTPSTTGKTTKKQAETTPSTTPTTSSKTSPTTSSKTSPTTLSATTSAPVDAATTKTTTKTTTTEATTVVGVTEGATATTNTTTTTTTEATATKTGTPTTTTTTTEGTTTTTSPSTLATTVGDDVVNVTSTTSESTTMSSASSTTTEVAKMTEGSTSTSTTATETTPTTSRSTSLTTENATETTVATTLSTTTTTEASTLTARPTILSPEHGANTCISTTCKRLAARMLATMDHKTDPCKDFYQYACGGVLEDSFMDPIDPNEAVFRRVKEKLLIMDPEDPRTGPARVFFDSCVNYNMSYTNRLEAVSNLLKKLGEFKKKTVEKSTFDITSALSYLLQNNFAPFFDVLLDVDDENNDIFAFKLTLPVFPAALSPSTQERTCKAKFQEKATKALHNAESINLNEEYKVYTKCIRTGHGLDELTHGLHTIAGELNLTSFIEGDAEHPRTLSTAIDDISSFFGLIYDAIDDSPSKHVTDHFHKDYTVMTVDEIQNSTFGRVVNWKVLFENLVGGEVDDSQSVQVYNFEDLKVVFEEIQIKQEEDEQSVENMLLLLWADRLYHDLVRESSGTTSTSRTDFCVHVTMRLLQDLSAAIYIHSFPGSFLANAQRRIRRKVEDTKKTLEVQMVGNKDVPPEFLNKLRFMNFNIGNPNIEDGAGDADVEQDLEKSMEGYTMQPKQFLNNTVLLMRRFRANMYKLFHNSTTSPEAMWNQYVLPQSTSGVYLYALNHFVIPYGAMDLPFYQGGVPDVINSAGIGLMISHEMMHAFDSTGLKYDGNKRYEPHDPLPTMPPAIAASECLNEQLQYNFSLPTKTMTTNTVKFPDNLPLNELMADSAALRLAWGTYSKEHPVEEPRELLGPGVPEPVTPLRPTDDLLPWLKLNHEQLFYLRVSQNQCEEPRTLLGIMERPHIPASLRINMLFRNDPHFGRAFNCPSDAEMTPREPCTYSFEEPTGLEH